MINRYIITGGWWEGFFKICRLSSGLATPLHLAPAEKQVSSGKLNQLIKARPRPLEQAGNVRASASADGKY